MWNAASTSPPRARYSLLVAAVALLTIAIAASSGAAPKPRPPRDMALTKATEDSLSLIWAPARERGDRTIVGYHVYLDGALQKTAAGADLVTETSFDFGSLRCGTTYTLGVEAVDDAGATSDAGSVMASTSPCPAAPPAPTPAPPSDPSVSGNTTTTPTASAPSDQTDPPATTSAPPTSTAPSDQTDTADTSGAEASVVAAAAPQTSGALTFAPTADARVDQSQPDANYGARKVLRVDGNGGSAQQSYLRFDVSGLGGSVTAAKLRLYATAATADGPTTYSTVSTWSETGITWNNRPALGSASGDVAAISANSWVEWDVTNLVSGDGTYSFALVGQSPGGVAMSSREGGAAPELVVSTDGTNPSPNPGPGQDATPPSPPGNLALVSRSTSDIAVSWTASIDDVGVSGYDLLVNGTKTGETTSLTASFGALACGQSYTIGVRAFDAAGNSSSPSSLKATTVACAPSGGTSVVPQTGVASGASSNGTFIVRCGFSHFRAADPIVSPGAFPSAHEHVFYGNQSVDENSTEASMRAASTNCKDSKDTAGYWSPSLYSASGRRITPIFSFAYYKNLPASSQVVQAYGAGLKMVFGPSGAFWDCFNSGGHETSQVPVCTGSGNYTVVRVKSLPCWNGKLDSADHRSHMSGMNGSVCPSDHPIKVPQINFFQRYPVGVGGPGVHFSDGSILPHVDFWNTWNQAALEDLVNRCLRPGINCGQVGG